MTAADAPDPGGARQPPDGYLGTAARITSGPAPELVEAGYALEIADAPLLHRGLTVADLAHLIELVECGALRPDEAAPLCTVLLDLLDTPAADFPYDPVYGDAYNSRERELERTLGPAAGRLHLGRTRREAGRIAFRLAIRDRLLGLHGDVAAFAGAVARQASEHAATLWADTTYLQPGPAVDVRPLPGRLRRAGRAAPGPDRGRVRRRGRLARGRGRGGRHPAAGGQGPAGRAAGVRRGRPAHPRRDVVGGRPGRRGRRGGAGRGDHRPAGQRPGDLRQPGVRLRDARRVAVPGQRAHAAEAQPVRAARAARRGGHADRPCSPGSWPPGSPRPRAPTTGSTPTARWPAPWTWPAGWSGWAPRWPRG